jgi:hypothetical protein
VDAVGYASVRGDLVELGAPVIGVGAGHDEMDVGLGGSELGEGFYEEVAAFFGVDATEVEEKALAANGGAKGVEGFAQEGGIGGWGFGAEGDDEGVPAVQPEGLRGE